MPGCPELVSGELYLLESGLPVLVSYFSIGKRISKQYTLCSFMMTLLSHTQKFITFGIGVIVLGSSIVACIDGTENKPEGKRKMSAKIIEEALREKTDKLMFLPGVVGAAQGLCNAQPCIKVYVGKKTPELEKKIRHILQSYPFAIEEVGKFRPLPEKQDHYPEPR